MSASSERPENYDLINDNHQDYNSFSVNGENQQSANRQFEANWFSPSLTSTQIVSFDVIDSDDDAQRDILLTYEKENIFEDISQEENANPADLSFLPTSTDQPMVSETPPPLGNLPGWDTINPSDYLFNSTGHFKSLQKQTSKAATKRQSTSTQNKKSSKMKKVKLEGYSCKLNGAVYHVVDRDLDVLEAIEKGLKHIQQTMRQHYMCNVRHLSFQLTQIETVLAILDDEQLGLGMPLEEWNEMLIHTKKKFQDTQHEIDACRRRTFELDTSTDELTHSFSQSLSISSSNQRLQQQHISDIRYVEKNQAKIIAKSINFESLTIRTSNQISIGGCGHDTQVISSSQIPNSLTNDTGILLQTSSTQRMERNVLSVKSKTNPKKKPNDVPHTSIILNAKRHHSTSTREKYLQFISATDDTRLPSDMLNLAPVQYLVPASDSTAYCSRKTLAIEENQSTNRQASKALEALPDVADSTAYDNESIRISNEILGNNQPSNHTPDSFHVSPDDDDLPPMEKEVVSKFDRVIDGQDDLFGIEESHCSSQFTFLGSKNRTPTIVKIGFHLRPFVLNGVLCPGKNNMKLTINSRIYVGSLAADGTIEMNGFNFRTIGNWIKSVEGKPFSKLSKLVQRTLDLQYNGKSLGQVLEVDEPLRSTVTRIPSTDNIAQVSISHPPMAESNFVQKRFPVSPPAIKNPTPYPAGTVSKLVHTIASISNTKDLQLVPEEMTRHIKTIFLHAQDEYFPICKCSEQFWCGTQPFPKHILDEVDSWK
ncbi:uncharacterized protein LOC130686655 [Daphnia carinata]|uniref:uncharacterized protein LOC130686655 n=1 Tax=Daphnia carinata TaxID=120202 RepID=UPI0028687E70|nr:uncharacterized protein LOC130686655 [Daphnia carinata]XP_059352080.1 uncharacterized protein LOC130686655 [Daphnia carinata]